jgi:hypothetical protein
MFLAAAALLPSCSAGGNSEAAAARLRRGRTLRVVPHRASRSATAAAMAAAAPLLPNGEGPWFFSVSARVGAPAFLGTVFAVGPPKTNGAGVFTRACAQPPLR